MKFDFSSGFKAAAFGTSALCLLASSAAADQVFLDDLIVDGSACIGIDCANGENFGFDTIRLKENNLRIKFDDTSASASFPNNDWQLTANDSGNGGANHFSIDDITGNKTPFRVVAGAPTNALWVAASGNVGVGVANAVVEMHIADGDSPTVRLEQNGSSGFTPQTWDLAGNETNFFIRDVTNSSKLPFRIRPGAPDDSIYIQNNGRIGLGTDLPGYQVHIKRATGTAEVLLELENNRNPILRFNNGNINDGWQFSAGNNFLLQDVTNLGTGAATTIATFTEAGDLTITGELTTAGTTCNGGCDLVFDAEYDLPSIEDHAEAMFELRHLPNVGPTLEGAPFNLTEKVGGMLNELEHAHIYIATLNARLTELEAALAAK